MKEQKNVKEKIARLFSSQRLAVLATQYRGGPYTSLVAFANSDDLSIIYFSTPITTRKFRNLSLEKRVSMLVDNRGNKTSDFHEAKAVTAVGEARELSAKRKKAALGPYLAKHPYLADFARSASCAVVEIRVEKYIMVERFQQVTELHMEK